MRPLMPLLLALAACAHGEPFEPQEPDQPGPRTDALPRQLTYNPGDDRSPAWTGGDVVYSRYDPTRGSVARCLAWLPAEGGMLRAQRCPPDPSPADTFVGTWLEPAPAPDGGRLAFVWQRGAALSALAAWSHHLVIASADSPSVPRLQLLLADSLPGGRRWNMAFELRWVAPDRVRFLAAWDSVPKVKGGGPTRFTDTLWVPLALLELNAGTGTIAPVPGGDSVIAHAPAQDGSTWIVKEAATTVLQRLHSDGGLELVATFAAPITDLAEADSRVVVALGGPLIRWLDPATGGTGTLLARGPVRRIAEVGGRRFVAEVEREDREFGAPANLWLFELPMK